jgi:hypothetical protein
VRRKKKKEEETVQNKGRSMHSFSFLLLIFLPLSASGHAGEREGEENMVAKLDDEGRINKGRH